MKATTHQQDWRPTSHNNSIITNPRYLTITIRCLVELLKAGTYGLTCLDLLNRDNGQFWTDR